MFGMSQSNVSKWVNLLHEVLNRTFAQQQVLPARDAATLATYVQMTHRSDETDTGVEKNRTSALEREPLPLFFMMGQNDRSIARSIAMTTCSMIVARNKVIP
jgi:hypothetical protein